MYRSKRITRGQFGKRVYEMSIFNEPEDPAAAEDEGDDPGDPGDRELPGPGGAIGHVGGEGGHGPAAADGPADPIDAPNVKLMREWLAGSMDIMCFFSVPAKPDEGEPFPMFFQLLAVDAKVIVPDTYTDDTDSVQSMLRVTVQKYERWAPLHHDLENVGTEAEVFILGDDDPATIDILRLTGADTDITTRQHVLHWSAAVSDVEGCVHLYGPKPLQPRVNIGDAKTPTLYLLDALDAKGFAMHVGPTEHCFGAPLLFDSRQVLPKKHYLLCLLISEDLWAAKSIERFNSLNSDTWYKYLLKFRREPPAQTTAKQLKQMMESTEAEAVALPALAALLPAVPAAAAAPDLAADEDIACDAPPPPPATTPASHRQQQHQLQHQQHQQQY